MGARPRSDGQIAKDLLDYAATLTPGEALATIGYLTEHYTHPRIRLATRKHPALTAVALQLVLVTIQALGSRVRGAVEITQADTEAAAGMHEVLSRSIRTVCGLGD